jgi:hypothetical protein
MVKLAVAFFLEYSVAGQEAQYSIERTLMGSRCSELNGTFFVLNNEAFYERFSSDLLLLLTPLP